MKNPVYHIVLAVLLFGFQSRAQEYRVYGTVSASDGTTFVDKVTVFVEDLNVRVNANQDGYYELFLPKGKHKLQAFSLGWEAESQMINVNQELNVNFVLKEYNKSLDEVEIVDQRTETTGIARLRSVEGFGIYEAKKNELIVLDDFAANKVTNNARQVFAKVPGLNIWESDFAGLQLDIAARGLGPSRTANFNTRQNGYDMSADALGYPESYYMPALQAVDRIEIVRGAASLQYGTQFGGMLNFRLKEAPQEPIQVNVEQAFGSFGYANSFINVGGTLNKFDYFGYYQYRKGDGWRENSGFDSHMAFGRIGYKANEKLKLGFEYSFLNYEAQQPGGLTNDEFESGNLEQSRRARNWFNVSWNLLAATIDYNFSDQTKLNIRNFGLFSRRNALGNLDQINIADDPTSNRTLIRDDFNNFGSEVRLLHYYNLIGQRSALLVGGRYYNGLTDRKQGDASSGSGPDFNFLNPEDLEDFDYDFPSQNYSLFAENVFNLSNKLSVTPGVRFEHVQTDAVGTWKFTVRDAAGNIVAVTENQDDKSVVRSFVLFGFGTSYHMTDDLNVYANYAENFRSVTFSDLRVNNPNFLLDSLITDESGYNIDLGVRGKLLDWLSADVSLFFLRYNDRIGIVLPPTTSLQFRTNVGDSRHYGIESYFEIDLLKVLNQASENSKLSFFSNVSLINATYIRSEDRSVLGRNVEYVPNVMFRSGINYSWKDLTATYQFSYLGDQFSDATNSVTNPTAVTGLIPSYQVMDVSLEYKHDPFKFTFGVNNLTDEQYFTRRAESYPGPGIIPATPRSFYVSFGMTF